MRTERAKAVRNQISAIGESLDETQVGSNARQPFDTAGHDPPNNAVDLYAIANRRPTVAVSNDVTTRQLLSLQGIQTDASPSDTGHQHLHPRPPGDLDWKPAEKGVPISFGASPNLHAERAEAARRRTFAIKEEMDEAPGEADVCPPVVAAEHIPLGDEVVQCDVASRRLRHTHHMASRRICHTSPTDGALAAALTVALATALAAALAATFAT